MSNDPNQFGNAPNPFAAAPQGYPPPRKSNVWLWVLGGAGGAMLLVCCGCGGLMYFGFNKGMGILGEKLVGQLNEDAVAKEHLGKVSSATVDFTGMISEAQKNKTPGEQRFLFHVKGDKASGDVTAVQATPGQEQFKNAKLRLPGKDEEIPLGF